MRTIYWEQSPPSAALLGYWLIDYISVRAAIRFCDLRWKGARRRSKVVLPIPWPVHGAPCVLCFLWQLCFHSRLQSLIVLCLGRVVAWPSASIVVLVVFAQRSTKNGGAESVPTDLQQERYNIWCSVLQFLDHLNRRDHQLMFLGSSQWRIS